MEKFYIEGPTHLSGEVSVSGSKNAALPIIAATILAKGQFRIGNIPDITDIGYMLTILESLGAKTKLKNNLCEIDTTHIDSYTPDTMVKNIRASILLVGPLLARFGKVKMAHPGGCFIGARPVDTHFDAFRELGATIKTSDDYHEITVKKLIGTKITLGEFSVTGTENIIMAAVLAEGYTEIRLAAAEPHVVDLCNFLIKMGARISGVGTHTLEIIGQKELHGIDYQIIPDQIEAGTFALAMAVSAGSGIINNFIIGHHDILLKKLKEANVNFKIRSEKSIEIKVTTNIKPVKIRTDIYPGFPTDLQAPFAVLMTQAEGNSSIYETLFEGRLNYLNELNKMGANCVIRNSHEATITGPTPLFGTKINSLDLRAGATLIIASIIAEGKSIIDNANIIDRGYEKIEEKFNKLGAKIERLQVQIK